MKKFAETLNDLRENLGKLKENLEKFEKQFWDSLDYIIFRENLRKLKTYEQNLQNI